MSGALTRFLGDSPLRVVLKLILVSFLVGLVMSTFGWSAADIVYGLRNLLLDLWHTGFATIDRFLGHLLVGAAVVLPAFFVLRLLSYRR